MSILRVEGLVKNFGEKDTLVHALKDCSFNVEKGEFIAIVGPSGSGKSTLLHICGGLDRPSKGKVYIDDQDIYDLTQDQLALIRRKKVGFVFQSYNLISTLSAEENILMPALLDGRKIDSKYVEELMNTFGIWERRYHLPSAMSGGQQQRTAIARALINRPSIIFADEPTGNLDRNTGFELLDHMQECMKKFNQTMVIITHDRDIASRADRIFTIVDGVLSIE